MKLLWIGVLIAPLILSAAPAQKKLAIVSAAFADSDDGAPSASDDQFLPGESLFFRCQVEGYKRAENNDVKQGRSLRRSRQKTKTGCQSSVTR